MRPKRWPAFPLRPRALVVALDVGPVLALVLSLALAVVLAVAAPVRATDVHGDDERDVYAGTGGLVLPGSVDADTRRQVAGCADCRWRLTTPCLESTLGTGFPGQPTCTSVVRGCPGGRLLRSWFSSGGTWQETGLVCLSDEGPVTVARLGEVVGQRAEQGIPPLQLAFLPAHGVLTQLPLVLQTGQPRGFTWRTTILGRAVEVTATATWTWRFGDGAVLTTGDPGDRSGSVSHVYRQAGDMAVTCLGTWRATFTVDGLGPFAVAEPLRQSADAIVGVREGRALLTPPGMAQ